MTFNECEKICMGIPILDDDTVEKVTTRTFSIHLTSTDNRIRIDQNLADGKVVIRDNERCKYYIHHCQLLQHLLFFLLQLSEWV